MPPLGRIEQLQRARQSREDLRRRTDVPSCSSHVYQVVPTPARSATSSRRSPGVRRRTPSGSPTLAGAEPRGASAETRRIPGGGPADGRAVAHVRHHSRSNTRIAPKLFGRPRGWRDAPSSIARRTDMATTGRTVLITGATDGVGRRVASGSPRTAQPCWCMAATGHGPRSCWPASAGPAGRRPSIPRISPRCREVHALAEAVRRDHHRLDVLVNNAGIGTAGPGPGRRRRRRDGHELRFAVNYLAGFLLTAACCRCWRRAARPGSSTSPPPASRPSISPTSC